MMEVNNQIKKKIYFTVDNTYLKGLNQGTLRLSNRATLAVLQYLFNAFGQVSVGDKDHNNEVIIKSYEPTTTIGWIFHQVDEGGNIPLQPINYSQTYIWCH